MEQSAKSTVVLINIYNFNLVVTKVWVGSTMSVLAEGQCSNVQSY